jgi:hypothetical protein
MNKWIVINTNPLYGSEFHGPFSSAQEANEYGYDHFDESDFFITQLEKEQDNETK